MHAHTFFVISPSLSRLHIKLGSTRGPGPKLRIQGFRYQGFLTSKSKLEATVHLVQVEFISDRAARAIGDDRALIKLSRSARLKVTPVTEGDSPSAIPRIYTLKEAAGVNRTYSLAEAAAQICGDSMKDPVLWMRSRIRAGTISVTGKVVRVAGKGLVRVPETKTAAGRRTLVLPSWAVDTLRDRRGLPYLGEQTMMFPSTAGTWRDPDNFGRQWRQVRDELGAVGVTSHSFRKSMATLIDDGGLSARIGADHLGHAQVSMTQNVYMSRGRVHPQVAELLEQVVISDE
jgi:hypothetical protein